MEIDSRNSNWLFFIGSHFGFGNLVNGYNKNADHSVSSLVENRNHSQD